MNQTTPKICEHGLNDRCVVSVKTVITDYKMERVVASYVYYCPDHESYGKITVENKL